MDTMNLAKAMEIAVEGSRVETQRTQAMETLAFTLRHLLTEENMNFKELALRHVVRVLTKNPLTAASAEELVGEKVDTPSLKKAQGVVEKLVSRPKQRLVTIAKRAERRAAKKKARAEASKAKKTKKSDKAKKSTKAKRTKSKKTKTKK